MKRIEIEEVANGYWMKLDDKQLVYSSVDLFKMLADLGKYLFGRKIEVKEN